MATRPDELYEEDFYAWTRHQARELRRLRALRLNTSLDLAHLAEEIRDLGSEQLYAIQSQATRLIEHLLKLEYSTHDQPRRQWMLSVSSARREIERRLTATLRKRLLPLPKLYERAHRWRAGPEDHGEPEAAASASDLPYDLDQLLAPDWLPPVGRQSFDIAMRSTYCA
ncbi:MAG: DUF29 domain-containing protein [Geminicoccaceae bacterium]